MQNCRRKSLDKTVPMDGLTDGQTAMAIPVYPLQFVVGGIMNNTSCVCKHLCPLVQMKRSYHKECRCKI